MATSGQMNEEQKIESVKRSKLYADILGIVSKLKLADSGGADAYDIPSISYELELYFLNESPLVDHQKQRDNADKLATLIVESLGQYVNGLDKRDLGMPMMDEVAVIQMEHIVEQLLENPNELPDIPQYHY